VVLVIKVQIPEAGYFFVLLKIPILPCALFLLLGYLRSNIPSSVCTVHTLCDFGHIQFILLSK
jgi:hypothetical protein